MSVTDEILKLLWLMIKRSFLFRSCKWKWRIFRLFLVVLTQQRVHFFILLYSWRVLKRQRSFKVIEQRRTWIRKVNAQRIHQNSGSSFALLFRSFRQSKKFWCHRSLSLMKESDSGFYTFICLSFLIFLLSRCILISSADANELLLSWLFQRFWITTRAYGFDFPKRTREPECPVRNQ